MVSSSRSTTTSSMPSSSAANPPLFRMLDGQPGVRGLHSAHRTGFFREGTTLVRGGPFMPRGAAERRRHWRRS
jgi:hypothetical protein